MKMSEGIELVFKKVENFAFKKEIHNILIISELSFFICFKDLL